MPWTNQDIKLYHGTSTSSLNLNAPLNNGKINIAGNNHGIRLAVGNLRAEFGPGFYTTTNLKQAEIWAEVVTRRDLRRPGRQNVQAAVISFDVNRAAVAQLNGIFFVRGTDDFWDLVKHCRSGNMYHVPPNDLYDVVVGPLTGKGNRRLYINSDQVSFHTVAALNVLPTPLIVRRWSPSR